MNVLSSLTNRIFLASAFLVIASITVAIYRVNASVTSEAEAQLSADLTQATSVVDEFSRIEFRDFVVKSQLIADLPVLKGAAATNDGPTVEPIAREYQTMIGADLFAVTGRGDHLLARTGRVDLDDASIASIRMGCRTSPDGTLFWPFAGGLLHAAAIQIDANLGTLIVGVSLDREAAMRIRSATNSEVVFVFRSRIVASSLNPDAMPALAGLADRRDVFTVPVGSEIYVGRAQPLGPIADPDGPVALVLRSRTDHLRFLSRLRWQIVVTALAAVFIATIAGYLVARTVTRPLRALSGTMREMAATGDLARSLPEFNRWDDEDVRLVAGTFRQLTAALDKFQREASLRDRLSSLGRLSTVIAHEVRNPLMIIKSAVHGLRRHPSPEVADIANSVDEEVHRLNHVVSGVLDFAKPIQFDLSPEDLGDICRNAAEATRAAMTGASVIVDAPVPAPIVTDAERVRSVLVNVITNAQQAMRRVSKSPDATVRVSLSSRSTGMWRIAVADRGPGIAAGDLARIFDPFFTGRRGGSGLGLAIARNIIEGLGGTIVAESEPGQGATILIDLPRQPAPAKERA